MTGLAHIGHTNDHVVEIVGAENASEQLNLILGLHELRVRRGLTICDVAETIGVDPSQVSRFETGGTNPTMSTIRRYAKAVGGIFRVRVVPYEYDRFVRRATTGTIWRSPDSGIGDTTHTTEPKVAAL